MPTVSFHLATPSAPMDSGHALWHQPLPKRPDSSPRHLQDDARIMTYGDYFTAVADFCTAGGWAHLLRAASSRLALPVKLKQLGHLSIFLEKHGAFYHPARLRLTVEGHALSFVVNVAASTDGRRSLDREVGALEQLNEERPFGWFPTVYGSASDPVPMFLGDWFDGFHEFHLTRRSHDGGLAIVLWDGAEVPCLLTEKQTSALYCHAAMILAACYDLITTCHIFPWHHAAGDFVVRISGNQVAMKMITVRNYAPLGGQAAEPVDERRLLDNLVVLLIHLSLRMRLDRLDGVSEIVWAPVGAVGPTIDGFFQGLDLTGRLSGFPDDFPRLFRHYFNHQIVADLKSQAEQVAQTVYDPRSEERRVIDRHLADHLDSLCRCMQQRE